MNTSQVAVADATEAQLDWLVTYIVLKNLEAGGGLVKPWYRDAVLSGERSVPYTKDPQWMWPIIDQVKIATRFVPEEGWFAEKSGYSGTGKTSLIAAARCYITAELGEVVDVPKVLMADSPTPKPADAEGDEPSTPTPGA